MRLRTGNLTAKFAYFLHSLDIRILISLKILHRIASEILVKFNIFDASISYEKYFRISLNLASGIPKWIICLFLNFATLDTYKNISLIVTYRYLCKFKLKSALINYGAI